MHGNVVTDVVSGVLNYRGRFCVDYHAVYAGTCYQWVCEVRSCCSPQIYIACKTEAPYESPFEIAE